MEPVTSAKKCVAAVYVNVRPFANAASLNSPVSTSKQIFKHIIQNDDSAQQLCRRSLAILRPGLSKKRKNLEPKGGRTKVQSFMDLDT